MSHLVSKRELALSVDIQNVIFSLLNRIKTYVLSSCETSQCHGFSKVRKIGAQFLRSSFDLSHRQ